MARVRPGTLVRRREDDTEERVTLRFDVVTLGRSDSCTMAVPFPTVSRLHARIELQHDRYMLFDADSANGTSVNGKPIGREGHHLRDGDVITLGSSEASLSFEDPEATLVLPSRSPPAALSIDERAHSVRVYDVPAHLSPLEYDLLLHLAHNPGTVCTRESCFLTVWGQPYDHATCEDALNACMAKLRRNLRAAAATAGHEPPVITTIQRSGFRLDAHVTFDSPA